MGISGKETEKNKAYTKSVCRDMPIWLMATGFKVGNSHRVSLDTIQQSLTTVYWLIFFVPLSSLIKQVLQVFTVLQTPAKPFVQKWQWDKRNVCISFHVQWWLYHIIFNALRGKITVYARQYKLPLSFHYHGLNWLLNDSSLYSSYMFYYNKLEFKL